MSPRAEALQVATQGHQRAVFHGLVTAPIMQRIMRSAGCANALGTRFELAHVERVARDGLHDVLRRVEAEELTTVSSVLASRDRDARAIRRRSPGSPTPKRRCHHPRQSRATRALDSPTPWILATARIRRAGRIDAFPLPAPAGRPAPPAKGRDTRPRSVKPPHIVPSLQTPTRERDMRGRTSVPPREHHSKRPGATPGRPMSIDGGTRVTRILSKSLPYLEGRKARQ
jgi:hypothetical protein